MMEIMMEIMVWRMLYDGDINTMEMIWYRRYDGDTDMKIMVWWRWYGDNDVDNNEVQICSILITRKKYIISYSDMRQYYTVASQFHWGLLLYYLTVNILHHHAVDMDYCKFYFCILHHLHKIHYKQWSHSTHQNCH